jgi:hypothetical protein
MEIKRMKKYYYVYLERFNSKLCSDGQTLEKFESKEEALKSAEGWIDSLAIQDKRCEKIQVWYADEITEENEDDYDIFEGELIEEFYDEYFFKFK